MRTYIKKMLVVSLSFVVLWMMPSCEKFLDVVPDNVATVDHAFKLRNEAEKYLFTLYSFLPKDGHPQTNVGMLAGDEIWMPYRTSMDSWSFEIALGNQRVADPYVNAWNGGWHGGNSLFIGLRHCNIFLENLNDPTKVRDITDVERKRWIGEAEFLKAYFHYYLLRMYGPIPLIRQNLGIDASQEDVNVYREPVDECVAYIVELLDQAAAKLPNIIQDRVTEMGRITQPIALAIKAKVLLMAASPLFNGNSDYASFKDNRGTTLFNPEYDAGKWEQAALATKAAIDAAEAAGHELFELGNINFKLSDTTLNELAFRQAIAERWNPEHIWANPNSLTYDLQLNTMPPLDASHNHNNARKILSPPLKIARLFYSSNGVPINEDKSFDFTEETTLRTATYEERFHIQEGFQTARINFDREPRFYASLAFDGAIWYKYDSPSQSDENTYVVRGKFTDYAGSAHAFHKNVTGYYIKKFVDWTQTMSSSGASYRNYAWPQVRLSDLYLMYAEALNEFYGPENEEIFVYLDKVRTRAGLPGVKEAWEKYSRNPEKFKTQQGLQDIIRQERLIELAFEGHRFWDLRRWKEAANYLNAPITGWNVSGENAPSYYQITTVYQQRFVAPRDYFWPISESTMIQNPNLVQNPGW